MSSSTTAGSSSATLDSMAFHRAAAPDTSRAARYALTTSAGSAPVSVITRDTYVSPIEFTTSFAAIVAISSRRSG